MKILNVVPLVSALHKYTLCDPYVHGIIEAEETTFITLVDAFTDAMLGPGMSRRAMPPVGPN